MALQSGAMAAPEKIPVQWYSHQQQPQPPLHPMDERDGFLLWLKSEFAAANAIIDALCHHLRLVGEPGEYDSAIGSIQMRRCNWNNTLHMQQYFSVADVVCALQQVSWRRQQRPVGFDGGSGRMGGGGKEFRRGGGRGPRGNSEGHNFGGEGYGKDMKTNPNVSEKLEDGGEKGKVDEKDGKKELDKKCEVHGSGGISQGVVGGANDKADAAGPISGDGSGLERKQGLDGSSETFVATEICDGKPINIAEGMKFYKDLFDDSEISKLITLVSDLRAAGRRGQLPGNTFVVSKRPNKGHGREMIQLGVHIADAPPEEAAVMGTSKDLKQEPIPAVMQDIIDRLLSENAINIKPDSCIIDVFNEGDHSQPHIWPHWFVRPVCVLFLTECDMTFGKLMAVDHPGDYRGVLKLSLSPGSVLVMQGKSADFARHAIPSLRKQRILVTLVKSHPRKPNDHRYSPVGAPPSSWAPPPSRSPSHLRPPAAKHLGPIPTSTILPAQTARPQLSPPNGIQPRYVPGQVTSAVAFATPVPLPPPTSAGWPATSQMQPPPRLPVPGTGVFLPSKTSSPPALNPPGPPAALNLENVPVETPPETENHDAAENHTSPEVDTEVPIQECNNGTNETTTNTSTKAGEPAKSPGAA